MYIDKLLCQPYSVLSLLPWRNGLTHKTDLLRYRTSAAFIALTRDRDSGSVSWDNVLQRPCVDYTPSKYDRKHTLQGAIALAKACYVSGAYEIRILHHDLDPFIRSPTSANLEKHASSSSAAADPELTDAFFATWLTHVRHTMATSSPVLGAWASAHQMGTCRMSGRGPHDGVVNARGQVWDVDGLHVADASVLPSASAVNPMVTVMAVADGIARAVAEDLERS